MREFEHDCHHHLRRCAGDVATRVGSLLAELEQSAEQQESQTVVPLPGGRAAAEEGTCALDGRALQPVADGLGVAVWLTIANGGSIRPVQLRHDLGPVGGIGALLRF